MIPSDKVDRHEQTRKAAIDAAGFLRRLASGDLAALRRMQPATAAPAFWRLAARNEVLAERENEWITIVKVLAILTPRGDPANRPPLHNNKRPLGAVLCDGGDPSWQPVGDRPMLSERRLIQLAKAPMQRRSSLLERAARMLSKYMAPGSGIDVTDIAATVLYPGASRRLFESYYRRLDYVDPNSN